MNLVYVEPTPISRTEAEAILATGNVSDVCDTLVRIAFFEEDRAWAETVMLRYLEHEDNAIASCASTCLGHLARIHGEVGPDVLRSLERVARRRPTVEVAAGLDDVR